jgi:hypothetical protein
MAPAGVGSYSGRYCHKIHSTTAITAKMVFLYVWEKLFLLDPEPWKCGESVVPFKPDRVATKSAWAWAGSVVERI